MSTSSCWRRSSTSTSSRPPSGARARQSPRCRSSRCSRSTRTRRPRAAIGAAAAAERLAQLDVSAIGNNHGAGPHAALTALAAMRRIAAAARDAPQHRPRQLRRRPGRLPALDPRVLRRVRRTGGRPRGAHHRRLLRHDARADRGDPGRARRAAPPARALRGRRAASCRRPRRRARARRSSPARCARASGS